jgi:hypothetical protein
MSEIDDEPSPERLKRGEDPFLGRLVRSAALDRPSEASRRQSLEVSLGALEPRATSVEPRSVALGAAVGLAAGVALSIVALRSPEPRPAIAIVSERPPATAAAGVSSRAGQALVTNARGSGSALPATRLPPCPKLVRAPGASPSLDDFEDGNARLLVAEDRGGTWGVQGAPSARVTPRPGTLAFPVPIPKGRGTSRYGLHLSGERMTQGSVGLSVNLAPGRCYDASAYAGVEFYARGTGRIYFGITQIDVMERRWGGLCTKDCYDAHRKPVDLGPEFSLFRVRWEELEQVGYGAPVRFDPARIFHVDFGVEPADTPFDFWIDDVRFISR